MTYTVRELIPTDKPILWTMLMHAAHEVDVETVQSSPALARYVSDWGRTGDVGMVAERFLDAASDTGAAGDVAAIGAAWLRLSTGDDADNRGYGYVAEGIPELAIAVVPEHRFQGIGTALLAAVMGLAKQQFPGVSLSVRGDNPVVNLYERSGFVRLPESEVVNRTGSTSYSMLCQFDCGL